MSVPNERKKFVLHETLLCNSVDFFNGAFNSSFKEGCEGVMNLPEDKPAAFAIFVKWLCTRRIPGGRTQSYLDNLVDLYIFADKKKCRPGHSIVCEVALKDTITDVIQDIATKYKLRDDAFVPILEKLWSISLPEPGLVRLVACIIVDSFVRKSHKEKASWSIVGIRLQDDKVICNLTRDNLEHLQIMMRLLDYVLVVPFYPAISGYSPWMRREASKGSRCFFHVYKDGRDCRATSAMKTKRIPRRTYGVVAKADKAISQD
ncbi:uncharacterized protein L3040_008937 [Drepanopeziza brunnea f. sp. 'multigermtubi']|uniref:uncharacterized protein n=1 Tax=Drepanopeziza brunnea f. sp. 'multigermtubi' TaxID=698441 RepID=UPI00238E1D1B|nr:hypothetical protein L3040_008937 [Drepanopeziza brunnea f. sp. 'multigermtubi']